MSKEEMIEYLDGRIKDMDNLIDRLSAMMEAGVSNDSCMIVLMLATIADDIAHIYKYILTN